ncbi:MAG: Fic family protein, partial [Bacilli bacterium]
LIHLKETQTEFFDYIRILTSHTNSAVNWFLYDYLLHEFVSSNKIENKQYNKELLSLYENNLLNDEISEKDIKLINKIVRSDEHILLPTEFTSFCDKKGVKKDYKEYLEEFGNNVGGQYRKKEVWIGNPKEGIEYAFHIPPKASEVEKYMQEFACYFNNKNNPILSNMFIKSALLHVIFIKIHPFSDGNGRTARVIMNHCVKIASEQDLGLNFKYPIINISSSLDLSRIEYFKRQNNVYFGYDVSIDNSEAINKWLNYILNMYDEQIYYLKQKIIQNEFAFYKMDNDMIFDKISTHH